MTTYGPKFPYIIHGVIAQTSGRIGEAPDYPTAIKNAQQWLRNNPTSGLEAIVLHRGTIMAILYSDTATKRTE